VAIEVVDGVMVAVSHPRAAPTPTRDRFRHPLTAHGVA
jgi:hypothetical protein